MAGLAAILAARPGLLAPWPQPARETKQEMNILSAKLVPSVRLECDLHIAGGTLPALRASGAKGVGNLSATAR